MKKKKKEILGTKERRAVLQAALQPPQIQYLKF